MFSLSIGRYFWLGALAAMPSTSLQKRDVDYQSSSIGVGYGRGDMQFDDRDLLGGRYGRITKVQLWCDPDVVWSMQMWFDGKPGTPDVRHKQSGVLGKGVYKELVVNTNEAITFASYSACTFGPQMNVRICYLSLVKTIQGADGPMTGSVTCGTANRPDMVARDHLGTGSRVGNRTLKGFIGQLDDDNRGIDGLGTLWTDPRPEYFSPFLGSIPGPGKKFLDDRNLVNAAGGGRKIVKVQLWCGGDTVYSMIPWYQGKSGASNSRHWQYASNVKAGIYKELILKPDEYITQVIYDVCPTPGGGSKLCFLALRKSTLNGPQTQMVTCGTARHTGQYQSTFKTVMVTKGDKAVGDRVLRAFIGTTVNDQLTGFQTVWDTPL